MNIQIALSSFKIPKRTLGNWFIKSIFKDNYIYYITFPLLWLHIIIGKNLNVPSGILHFTTGPVAELPTLEPDEVEAKILMENKIPTNNTNNLFITLPLTYLKKYKHLIDMLMR